MGATALHTLKVRRIVVVCPALSTAVIVSRCRPDFSFFVLILSLNELFLLVLTFLPSSFTVTRLTAAEVATLNLSVKLRDAHARRTPATPTCGVQWWTVSTFTLRAWCAASSLVAASWAQKVRLC